MQVFRSLTALKRRTAEEPARCVAAIGAFDGLHLGHQAILHQVYERARARGGPSVVFSFEPTPREFLCAHDPPARLTRFRERVALLQSLGMDRFFCPPFNERMQHLGVEEFIRGLLVEGVRPVCVVVGEGFRFAHRREGTVERLIEAGRRHGFEVVSVRGVEVGGVRVSSSEIRRALAAGDLRGAHCMLGRPYSMTGRVLHGRRLGRKLGVPTANFALGRRVSPLHGVFAVRVHGLAAGSLAGVASLGTRPTVEGAGKTLLEVHIFDFAREIYGTLLTVEFVARLREERRFATLQELVDQMHEDCARARTVLGA